MNANTSADAHYYLGIMSGTSADGIDLALVDFNGGNSKLVAFDCQAYSEATRQQIISLYNPGNNEIDQAFSLDVQLAHEFAQAVNTFLAKQKIAAENILAIGNHGQTIRHRPTYLSAAKTYPFTLQICCNHTLAALTGIRVIGQFRHKDIAYGGQGAPLVPAFHQHLCQRTDEDVLLVNIGGIANISYLPAANSGQPVIGFDTGPGNCLLDAWYQQHHCDGMHYDKAGNWAASGQVQPELLTQLMTDDYFTQPAPKSTGREYFHLDWLASQLAISHHKSHSSSYSTQDIQATLSALTSKTIANEIKALTQQAKVYICGGGSANQYLLSNIKQSLSNYSLDTINTLNIDTDAIEAMAFAWLAYAFDKKITGNIPSVTGASKALVLGAEFLP